MLLRLCASLILPVVSGLFVTATVLASDLAREQRMAEQIVDAILDGEPVYLDAGDHRFLSIYTETGTPPVKGTAIILHGRGFHPDWQDVVNPLRTGLAAYGWNTLSIQLPVLEKQAKYYDYVPLFPAAAPRIDAAIAFARAQLKQQGGASPDRVVLIAHSCGAHMAMAWSDVDSIESIDAYVGIGMGATDYRQPMKKSFPLEKLGVPVLDLYAENDYPAVLKMAPARWRKIQSAGNRLSRQVVLKDSDHYHVDRGEPLTQAIAAWLATL